MRNDIRFYHILFLQHRRISFTPIIVAMAIAPARNAISPKPFSLLCIARRRIEPRSQIFVGAVVAFVTFHSTRPLPQPQLEEQASSASDDLSLPRGDSSGGEAPVAMPRAEGNNNVERLEH